MQRVLRVLPCSQHTTHLQPFNTVNLPFYCFCSQPLVYQRFLCSQTDQSAPANVDDCPTGANAQRRSKCKLSSRMKSVLDSYNLINLLNERPWNEDTVGLVQNCNAKLTSYVVTQVIRLCVDLDTALQFYKCWRTVDSSNCPDSYMYVALLHRLGTAGRIEEMEAVASECEANCMVTMHTFTVQLAAYRRINNLDGVLRTWKLMENLGLRPCLLSFATMIDAFASMKMYDAAADLYLLFLWEKFSPNVRIITVLIHHLASEGKLDSAMAIFNSMLTVRVRPNALTYAFLIKGYADLGNFSAVVNLIQHFKDMGNRPHRDSFKILFEDMVHGKREEDALKVMHELWPELSTQDLRGLICYYQGVSKKGGPEEGDDLDFMSDDEGTEDLPSNSMPLWNIAGFIGCLSPWTTVTAAALENAKIKWDGHFVLEIMKRIVRVDVGWKFFIWVEGQQGFTHDKFTYMAMIRLLLKEGNFAIVKQLLVEAQSKQLNMPLQIYNKVLQICGMRKEANAALDVFSLLETVGLKPDSTSYQYLIHVLHKCWRFWRAATVFAEMEKAGFAPTALIYSFVVCGFAEAGQMKYARAYYSKMRASGFEPSTRIFHAFISGYYRIGTLEKAEQVFEQMVKAGIEPSVQVYDLMIKVFKRVGKKAELHKIECESEALLPSKWVAKQRAFDRYLQFYQIFKDSLSKSECMQLCATG